MVAGQAIAITMNLWLRRICSFVRVRRHLGICGKTVETSPIMRVITSMSFLRKKGKLLGERPLKDSEYWTPLECAPCDPVLVTPRRAPLLSGPSFCRVAFSNLTRKTKPELKKYICDFFISIFTSCQNVYVLFCYEQADTVLRIINESGWSVRVIGNITDTSSESLSGSCPQHPGGTQSSHSLPHPSACPGHPLLAICRGHAYMSHPAT